MKTIDAVYAGCLLAAVCSTSAVAQKKFEVNTPMAPPPPPPVIMAPAAPVSSQVYVYEQKPAPARAPLVTPEQAQGIIDKFKAAYPKLGNPRFVVTVNRKLVDHKSGPKTETKSSPSPQIAERKDMPLADRQTIRDIERLFGRPLRMAGASLADQDFADELSDKPAATPAAAGEQARRDREALSKLADVALEILIAPKNIPVAEPSGDRVYALPDIQATAVNLKDGKILSQASSSDVMHGNMAYFARNYDVLEITEATALALMEDMILSAPAQAASKQ